MSVERTSYQASTAVDGEAAASGPSSSSTTSPSDARSGPRSRVPWSRLRRLARIRPLLAVALVLAPIVVVVALDWTRRGERIAEFDSYHKLTYLGSLVEATFVWGLLVVASSRRSGWFRWVARALFVGFLTFAIGGQSYFFQQYNAYLNVDVSLFATNFADSVVNQLFADFENYVSVKAPILLMGLSLIWLGRHLLRPSRRWGRVATVLAPAMLAASFFIPTQHRHVQAAVPDMLYMHAVGGLLRTQLGFSDQSNQVRPRARESLPVPDLTHRAHERNVLFVITESVRADATCIDYDPNCRRTEATNQLFPNRFPLRQMRSLDSCTAISLAVLWGGIAPIESRDVLHTQPLIFDYARAAGYYTAFWTSQNMMFGNARLWVKNLGVDSFFSATDLDPTADLDLGAAEHLLADRAIEELPKLKEPFLAVVQLSNAHYPYYVDPDGPRPFQPATTSKAPEDNQAFFNYYQNAVYQQDQHLARVLERLRESDAGKRTVIVYTSDHGEAFREHGQMGHTFSVLDEEVRVPAWIDAPPGTLTSEEETNLRNKANEFQVHPDLTATVLDLIGAWKAPEIAEYRERMVGESLLDEAANQRALPMTNCAGVWSCAFENWGYIRGHMKLEARAWDRDWHCYDLLRDPNERTNLGVEACGDLVDRAVSTFERLPGKRDD